MGEFLTNVITFLAILNPFALCLYLAGVMEDLSRREFFRVLLGACGISLVVFWLCSLFGEDILSGVIGVQPASMRVFGGLIFLAVGYGYAVKGYKQQEMLRGSLDELPSVIALPFMIGAGTVTQSILISKRIGPLHAGFAILISLAICLLAVVGFKLIRDTMRLKSERLFDRWVNILARLNGLLIGAISVEMIVNGLHSLWACEPPM
jgi:multiple antibiotic resistance protein